MIEYISSTNYYIIFTALMVPMLSSSLTSQSGVVDTVITIIDEDILFDSDQYELDSIDIELLRSLSREDTVYTYLLTGHTDSDGSNEYNLELSENRVKSVRDHLVYQLNMDSTRIEISFKGESEPITTNVSAAGKQKNRRVSVKRQYPVRLRPVTGSLISNSGKLINEGYIYMESRYYRDSFPVMEKGTFQLSLPDGEFVRLNVAARNHFYVDTLLKVTPKWNKDSLMIGLPFLNADQRYTLPQMNFVGNQDVLLERSLSSLDALTKTMIHSDVCAIIEGHVNRPSSKPEGPGTFTYNLALARSARIYNHLKSHGVDSIRMNPIGYSNWYMLYPQAKTERDQELNRRVEMVIKDCDDLFTINQKNAIMPKEIGTTIRLHDIDH